MSVYCNLYRIYSRYYLKHISIFTRHYTFLNVSTMVTVEILIVFIFEKRLDFYSHDKDGHCTQNPNVTTPAQMTTT